VGVFLTPEMSYTFEVITVFNFGIVPKLSYNVLEYYKNIIIFYFKIYDNRNNRKLFRFIRLDI